MKLFNHDRNGVEIKGLHPRGYDAEGFNRLGLDKNGDGFDIYGLNALGLY